MISATCLVLTAWLALASGQAQDAAKQAETPAQKSTTAETATPAATDSNYKIGPEDTLRIDVWKETEISRTIPVRSDGKISLPLLNDIQAAGLTPLQLSTVITEGLKKYMNNPQVTITVMEVRSRRIYVTGEVTRGGAFPLLPGMTALQAVTSAGGFTPFAKTKAIYILRMENGKQVKHPFNYKDVVNGKKPEDNIQLEPGDTIVVP